jgi:hypothetical protein
MSLTTTLRSYAARERANSVRVLARRFAHELRQTLTADQMAMVLKRNADPAQHSGLVCASHDFCDANVCMIDAFELTVGREPDASSDEDTDLINAAWSAARNAQFDPVAIL